MLDLENSVNKLSSSLAVLTTQYELDTSITTKNRVLLFSLERSVNDLVAKYENKEEVDEESKQKQSEAVATLDSFGKQLEKSAEQLSQLQYKFDTVEAKMKLSLSIAESNWLEERQALTKRIDELTQKLEESALESKKTFQSPPTIVAPLPTSIPSNWKDELLSSVAQQIHQQLKDNEDAEEKIRWKMREDIVTDSRTEMKNVRSFVFSRSF
jgi:hypothetical protein